MKNNPFISPLLIVCFLLVPPVSAVEQSLLDLVNRASEWDSDFLASRAQYAAETEQEAIARSEFYPNASINLNRVLSDDTWNLSGEVSQSVLNLSHYHLLTSAKKSVEGAHHNFEAAQQNLRQTLILAWLELHQQEEILRVTLARKKTLEEQVGNANLLAQAGRTTKTDVLASEARLASVESQIVQTKHDIETGQNNILRLTGWEASLKQLKTFDWPMLSPLANWLGRLSTENFAILSARAQMEAEKQRLKAAEATVFPRLSISGGVVNARGKLDKFEERLQIGLQQFLFQGSLSAEKRRLLALSNVAKERYRDALLRGEETVRRLYGQINADQTRIVALQRATNAAELFLKSVTIGYNSGVRVLADVLLAEEDLFNARLQHRQAAYRYLENVVRLHATLASLDDHFINNLEGYFLPFDKKEEEK